jgi:chitin synthase
MSAVYALIMMAVMVGIMLQISEDGLLAPTTLSIFMVGGSFVLSAVMHPQEFWCLPYGVVYYITIPAMYLLLVIYSIFNLNVVSWGTRSVRGRTRPFLAGNLKLEFNQLAGLTAICDVERTFECKM